ncbi:hypothetical protein ATK36_0656 [Amycolatopsis sulphurea]|uniref:Uncharacterized protein n=1 Tax=Amycolatopsis sulphurea TaxID=76022 RepID=A0A2A9G0Z5_9PSEU|nr:hypothetical protein ATK36_0656 [Amycolatopsis sulphurea]
MVAHIRIARCRVPDQRCRNPAVECGEECATPEQGGTPHRLGWHDPGEGRTTLIVGAYPMRGEIHAMVRHCTAGDAAPLWRMIDGSPALRE